MTIYHNFLGEVEIRVVQDGQEIEVFHNGAAVIVSKKHLAFSPFVDYTKPAVCVIVAGGRVDEILANSSFVEAEVVDFDSLALSTGEKEKMFAEKLKQFPNNI